MTDSEPTRIFPKQLWTARSVDDTQALYSDWAKTYDEDVQSSGYATPGRVAEALVAHAPAGPVLDFGCGTGLSGVALRAAGVEVIDGCDINPAMQAELSRDPAVRSAYRDLWIEEPGQLRTDPGAYSAIACTGVISHGAAPPETLDMLLDHLDAGSVIAFSFNDATRIDPDYIRALNRALDGRAERLVQAYGPHLPAKGMGSDVYVLRRL